MLATSSRIGADEITCLAVKNFQSPPAVTAVMVQRLVLAFQRRLSSLVPMWIFPPPSSTRRAAASHIMPGPLRGYSNDSISVLIWGPLAGPRAGAIELRSALDMALHRSRHLMRCAAQSAEISSQLIPHTFSV